jgi:hypothetical protein
MKSESIKELATALANAQGELEHAKKDTKNEYFKSKYATLAGCIDAAKPILVKNGLAVIQTTDIMDSGAFILNTILTHSSGEYINGKYLINPVKQDPQSFGSAVTYARRYAFCAIIGLAADDDDDGNGTSGKNSKTDFITNEQAVNIDLLINEVGADKKAFLNYFRVSDIKNIDVKNYDSAIAMLEKKRKPKEA